MAAEQARVAVYVHDAGAQELAESVLRRVRPDEVTVHQGVVEGWVDEAGLAQLAGASLVVDPLDRPPPGSSPSPPEALVRRRSLEPDSPELIEFKRQSKFVSLTDGGFDVSDQVVSGDAFDPRIHGVGESGLRPKPEDALDDAVYHIHLRAPITGEQRRKFRELGISLAAHEPPHSYRAFLTRAQYTTLLSLPFVDTMERCRLAETVTPQFLEEVLGDDESGGAEDEGATLLSAEAESAPPTKTFDVVLHRVADLQEVEALITSVEGTEVLDASELYIRFSSPKDARFLAALATHPAVRRMGVYRPPTLLADRARVLVGIETLSKEAPGGLTGEGEVVAVFDSGIDRTHPDLVDRVASVQAFRGGDEDDRVGHGTHVAGIIAGTGAASDKKIRGMAPGAKLAVIGVVSAPEGQPATLLTPANWAELLQLAVENGAKIVNLSAGLRTHGEYDFGSLSMDEFVHKNPEVLVVVAAGNTGDAPEGFVRFSSIFSPASAKNILTVGASCSDRKEPAITWGQRNPSEFPMAPSSAVRVCGVPDVPAGISSRGPTEFDSVKPDLLAPGTQILSARAVNGRDKAFWEPDYPEHGGKYGYMGGTSMAAPVVAGAAAVLRQYLRLMKNKSNPSAALMKAILIGATKPIPARDLPADAPGAVGYPDFDQGFGVLDLSTVIPDQPPDAPNRKIQFVDWPNDSDEALISRPRDDADKPRRKSRVYQFSIMEGSTLPVQVVLTWTDYPSSGVQNNLHLEVEGPEVVVSGNPKHLYHRTGIDALIKRYNDPKRLGGQPNVDKNNNVERVTVDSPGPGSYKVTVMADNTPFPLQGYALCVVGDISSDLEPVG